MGTKEFVFGKRPLVAGQLTEEIIDMGILWHHETGVSTNSEESMGTKGPTVHEYDIMVFLKVPNEPIKISIEFYTKKGTKVTTEPPATRQPRPKPTEWRAGKWSRCSTSCGPGQKRRK